MNSEEVINAVRNIKRRELVYKLIYNPSYCSIEKYHRLTKEERETINNAREVFGSLEKAFSSAGLDKNDDKYNYLKWALAIEYAGENERLIDHILRRYNSLFSARIGKSLDKGEIYSYVLEQLTRRVMLYDYKKNIIQSPYLSWYIRNAILAVGLRILPLIRVNYHVAFDERYRGKYPEPAKKADEAFLVYSLDNPLPSGCNIEEIMPSLEGFDTRIENLFTILNKIISDRTCLSEREATVLGLRFGLDEHLTLEKIGSVLGNKDTEKPITRQRVWQIQNRALRKLRNHRKKLIC